MTTAPDIFLSYNREDAEVARRFADAFAVDGFDVWWDQALRSGEAYDEVTEAALRNARAVVVLWSKRSVVSRWVRAEASIADENGTLTPVKIEPCDLPVMFRLTQTADLTHWQGAVDDRSWQAFLGDVRRKARKDAPASVASPGPATAPSDSGIPIVAVLPITCRGGGQEMEFLAEDLTEEITRELSRSSFCKVTAPGIMAAWRGKVIDYLGIGQQLGARYLAEGKLQANGDSIRLTMQIIETATGEMRWTRRFVHKSKDVVASPDELTAAVVAELNSNIHSFETGRARARSGPLSGWDHFMRSHSYFQMLGSDSIAKGIAEARQAIAKAPDLGPGHAILVSLLGLQVTVQAHELDDGLRHEIQEHIRLALQLDPNNPSVITWLVTGYAALGDGASALRLAQRLRDLNPHYTGAHLLIGFSSEIAGKTHDAIAAYEKAEGLTAIDSTRYTVLTNLGRCYLLEGRPDDAAARLDGALALHPDWHTALKWRALAAAQLGDEAAALATVRRLRDVEPDMTIDDHVRQMMTYTGLRDRLAEPEATLHRLWEATEGETKSA